MPHVAALYFLRGACVFGLLCCTTFFGAHLESKAVKSTAFLLLLLPFLRKYDP
jgi:hypothetical protein